jgi:hypothetical protein
LAAGGSKRGRRRWSTGIGLLAALVLAMVPGSASADGWRLTQLPLPGGELHSKLLGVSCPAPDLCVAVGEGSVVATSTRPEDGSAWRLLRLDVDEPPESPSESGRGPMAMLDAVSCPSERLCVGVTFDGYVVHTTNPRGGIDAWNFADVDGNERDTHLMSVSCPTETLCVAVCGERNTAGKILTSTDPTGGASAWSELQLDESLDLRGVSCGTPKLCVAGNFGGNLIASAHPLAGAGAWSSRNGGGAVLVTGVTCLSDDPVQALQIAADLQARRAGTPLVQRPRHRAHRTQRPGREGPFPDRAEPERQIAVRGDEQVARAGFEPATPRFSVVCSTN